MTRARSEAHAEGREVLARGRLATGARGRHSAVAQNERAAAATERAAHNPHDAPQPTAHSDHTPRDPESDGTYPPKKRYRRPVHGFMTRMRTGGGARVIQHRRRKGRARLGAS